MEINKKLAEELNIKISQVDAVLKLLSEGDTIPFIARYRKEVTGSLDDEILRKFEERLAYLNNLQDRMNTVIGTIEEQGKMTDELREKIDNCQTLSELEDLYRPYKPKKKTRAVIAKQKGLEPLSEYILEQVEEKPLMEKCAEFIDEEKGVKTAEEALQGAKDIIAEKISDDPDYRKVIKRLDQKKALITSKEVKKAENDVYGMYSDYQELISKIPPHRILALNRGEKEKCLRVAIETPEEEILNYLELRIIDEKSPFEDVLKETIKDAYERLIAPSIENEIRNDLEEKAEDESMEVFKDNLMQVLLQSPIKDKVVLGFDPGYSHGCKLAVVDGTGKVLATDVIRPTLKSDKEAEKAKKVLLDLIKRYHIDLIALGNGTASRESENFLKNLIKENNLEKQIKYLIVSEAGASVYSATDLAKKEFPDFDVNLRSAVSIARRLQDPLAELVKIPPESIGVGQYQHDMNQKRLKEVLGNVVEDCVNSVGVNLNSASVSLLNYVSGISPSIAKNIVAYRDEHGNFRNREELLSVKMLGQKAYEQCAGFLRLEGDNPLDNTAVHPESYETAKKLLKSLNLALKDLGSEELISSLNHINDINALAKSLNVGVPTLEDIIAELKRPGRDIREDYKQVEYSNDIMDISDLKVGMQLYGTVRNIMDFGCFVDLGVHVDGLVHISELSNKFIKNPREVVHVNDVVKVKVISVDVEKKRIGLSMKQVSNA